MITEEFEFDTPHMEGKYEIRHIVENTETKFFTDTMEEAYAELFKHCVDEKKVEYAKKYNYAKDSTGIYFIVDSGDVCARWVYPTDDEDEGQVVADTFDECFTETEAKSLENDSLITEMVDSALEHLGCK